MKREAAVTKEMNAKMADDKKLSRKEKDERILWKKNEVTLTSSIQKFCKEITKKKILSDLQVVIQHINIDFQQVAEYESTTFAIFYNNALFLSVLIFVSFYIFPTTMGASINYVASMGVSAGLIALLSTGTASA